MDKLYGFFHNSNTWESADYLVSVHISKENAEKEMEAHKFECKKQWQTLVDIDEDKGTEFGYDTLCPFERDKIWKVVEIEVNP